VQQIPPDWIERRHLTGRLKFGETVIECRLDEAVMLGERMAICRIDGGLSEQEADRVTLAQWQDIQRRFEERR
jgi:hypothetical protein